MNNSSQDFEVNEKASNYGTIGDPYEPLLKAALEAIQLSGRPSGYESRGTNNLIILNELNAKNTLMIAD